MQDQLTNETPEPDQPGQQQVAKLGGYALLPKDLLEVWPYLPEHHMRLLPLVLSFQPNPVPSQETLAKLAGVGRQAANTAVGQMVESGLLKIVHRVNEKGGNTTCFYALNVDDPSARRAAVEWYRRRFRDTPVASKRRHTPLSRPEGDSPCRVQDTTAPVASKARQPLSPLGGDINIQENKQENGQERKGEAASPPAASGGSPSNAARIDSPIQPARGPTKTPAKPKLTDDLKRLLRSDVTGEQMVGYYCHGSAAVGKPLAEWVGLKPSNTHWAPQTRNYGSPEPDVKVPALAAYCWCRFSQARGQAGEAIELPTLPKLLGTIKSLRARMTQDDVVGLIDRVAANWPAIRAALAWMSSPPVLDEVVLNNRHVVELSNRIARGERVQPAQPSSSRTNLSPGWQIKTEIRDEDLEHLYAK